VMGNAPHKIFLIFKILVSGRAQIFSGMIIG
jgi:hypothetical protein